MSVIHSLIPPAAVLPPTSAPVYQPEQILALVAREFQVPVHLIKGASREKQNVISRHVAAYLLYRHILGFSLNNIGKLLGGRHHTTIMYSHDRVKKLLGNDEAFRTKVERLSGKIIAGEKPLGEDPPIILPDPSPAPLPFAAPETGISEIRFYGYAGHLSGVELGSEYTDFLIPSLEDMEKWLAAIEPYAEKINSFRLGRLKLDLPPAKRLVEFLNQKLSHICHLELAAARGKKGVREAFGEFIQTAPNLISVPNIRLTVEEARNIADNRTAAQELVREILRQKDQDKITITPAMSRFGPAIAFVLERRTADPKNDGKAIAVLTAALARFR
ncbi:MAG: helix-turn-helix domain-containing protein [Dongiaceae bacterium]